MSVCMQAGGSAYILRQRQVGEIPMSLTFHGTIIHTAYSRWMATGEADLEVAVRGSGAGWSHIEIVTMDPRNDVGPMRGTVREVETVGFPLPALLWSLPRPLEWGPDGDSIAFVTGWTDQNGDKRSVCLSRRVTSTKAALRLPDRVFWWAVVANGLILAAILWCVWSASLALVGRLRRVLGKCVACGYSMRRDASHVCQACGVVRCPECGETRCKHDHVTRPS